jgi:hypothetical protein
MRSAFLEGGGYAKLTHYGKITDSLTGNEVDGHQLWPKRRVQIMIDIDNYMRSNGLPAWDINEGKRIAEKIKVSANSLEGYLAAPGYKALAQSTTNSAGLGYFYGAATFETAREGAIAACKKYNPGDTCKIVDPPESDPAPASSTLSSKPDNQDTTTTSLESRANEETHQEAGK